MNFFSNSTWVQAELAEATRNFAISHDDSSTGVIAEKRDHDCEACVFVNHAGFRVFVLVPFFKFDDF